MIESIELHENPKYIQSLFFVQVKNLTRRKLSTKDLMDFY
jgi:hypothetical protein